MNRIFIQLLLALSIICLACSYNSDYKKTIKWINNIKPGTSIAEVKNSQPGFLTINWDRPSDTTDRINHWVMYLIEIKNTSDLLKMKNGLIFANEKYVGRYTLNR